MNKKIRVVHYINQFFGGIGGEEANTTPVQFRDGAVGPGRALNQALGDRGMVTLTIIAGDNYFVEEEKTSVPAIKTKLKECHPDLVLAGPAFDAGRYGLACALVCRAANELGIPAVTGMVPDNAGVLTYGHEIYVVPTGNSPSDMGPSLSKMVELGLKMTSGAPLGPAQTEGYLPRGIRRGIVREKPGAERAVDMALARIFGKAFASEIPNRQYDVVVSPPRIADLSQTTVALLTTAGIVPKGNPDGLVGGAAKRKWVSYDITEVDALTPGQWESVHGGFKGYVYNTVNPNYALPLPALRTLEAEGVIKAVHPEFFSVVGASCAVSDARRMGKDIAQRLKNSGVDAVILEST